MRRRVDLALAAGPEAPREARRSLDDLTETVSPGILDDLRLLVSELVTNSIRHAGVKEGTPIALRVVVTDSRVRAEVVDPGPGFERREIVPSLYQTSGWGLYFVGEIADRWGVFHDHGTHVWFEVDLADGPSELEPSVR
jgi:anti-sigma regulatory factor (Ser/Thr protein kinase)